MRRYLLITLFAIISFTSFAQEHKHQFDPEKFEAKLEEYVVTEAKLTNTESQKVLPLFREMRKQIRELMDPRKMTRPKGELTDKDCEKIIKERDSRDVKMKQIQQSFHEKFLNVVPATKVLKMIHAEDKFMQDAFGEVKARRDGGHGPQNKDARGGRGGNGGNKRTK